MKIPESIKLRNLVLKAEHGSRINWVFNCGLRISIPVGLLGVVGILWVIKAKRHLDFNIPEKDDAPTSFWVVPGLENLGNNCFLNVVLQALASCVSFRNHLWEMMEEYGSLSVEEGDENVPLVNALASLVEELCTIRHKRTVLSPRKLMLAMDHYIPNFNLAMQQDSEEAFSHLLSSLREEISCLTIKSCLAELPALRNGRIVGIKSSEEESEWQRWSRSFLKPFDGILGSVLFCKSCSFQICLDYQLFHSLHLSPPVSNGGTIIAGCTLQDCIKQFFAAERIENYSCSNCWHNAAIGYLSAFAEDKTDIEKLQSCNADDSCQCKILSSLEAFPWSNRFSRTFKQMSIARSPKILCVHLQRASYNMFGQSVKLTGHISFPFVLDFSQFSPLNQSTREIRAVPYPKYQSMPFDPRMLRFNASNTAKSISMETDVASEKQRNAVENGIRLEPSESILPSPTSCTNDNVDFMAPSRPQMYRLVSVVEHFGNSGSGHYTVYRKVRGKLGDEDHVGLLESALEHWFCISDSQVDSVSEKEVLDANASLLFYEKIEHT
ncbi:hypothetical protein ACS0TY_030546 [Phlomoides rotata]